MNGRPSFEPLGCGLVECDSGGVTGSDCALFDCRKLRWPLCPLDTGLRGTGARVYPGV